MGSYEASSSMGWVASGMVAQVYESLGYDVNTHPEHLDDEQRVDLFIELTKISKAREDEAKELSSAASALHEGIVQYFQEKQQQSVNRRGVTLYLAREIWPQVVADDLVGALPADASQADIENAQAMAKARLIQALKSSPETAHLVAETFNHMSLRSWMGRDCDQDELDTPIMPEHLQGKLRPNEVFKAKVRRS